ncbi:squalene/phytoene synthase family protein [Bailinhaonella thermotolerans]|uniref:Phytoene synthase n=1 Tax=Bailinhaonella thermotolerans TaxID=1070861 RepID=A0A3A4B073_9ACTN|nr:squalene/phytoene synthase family protein [Bailinhaonella thermotolerans]RJL34239.1 hypothetical protein D5H75_07175 [Bailinhaonella thermotolerans]
MIAGWNRALDLAGIADPGLRSDYAAAAWWMARHYPALHVCGRLLVPPASQPHLLAAVTATLFGDGLVDDLDRPCPGARFPAWAAEVRRGLLTGRAGDPLLRAFLHTLAVRRVPHLDVHLYLAGQAGQAWVAEYVTDQDHHDYVERVAVPTIRLWLAGLGASAGTRDEPLVRSFTDAIQRLDDLADLSADLRHGKMTIPQSDRLHYGVARADLESGRDTPGVRALLAHACRKARASLAAARADHARAGPEARAIFHPFLPVVDQLLAIIERQGPALTRHGVIWHARPTPGLLAAALGVVVSRPPLLAAGAARRPR